MPYPMWGSPPVASPDEAGYEPPGPRGSRGVIVGAGLGPPRQRLTDALAESHDVRVFGGVTAAIRALHRIRPDTVIAGFDEGPLPARALLAAARAVEATAVLALIDRTDGRAVEFALAAGAHDVVAPPHTAQSVLLRRQVLRSSPDPAPAARARRHVALGRLTIDLTTRQVRDGDGPLTLSRREFELLLRLVDAAGKVVERTELLTDIWGADQGSEAVLDATVHRLRRRLSEKIDGDALITTVRGVGFRLRLPGIRTRAAHA